MLIDWFTVGAQALNFIILVWLMRHFLYHPILSAIDAREKKIAAELADADAQRVGAKKARDEFQHKNEDFDQQRAALLTKATDEAKAEGQRLLHEARKAADDLSKKRLEALRSDAKKLNQAISRRAQEEVFAIARKALIDLATTGLEERMVEVFTRRLHELDGNSKEALGAGLTTGPEPAVVRSAFALPAEERAKIQNAINEAFSADVRLRFDTAPDRIGGIELTVNGQKLAWSIADYLTSLEKGVSELLDKQEKPELAPEAEPNPKFEADSKSKSVPKPTAPTPSGKAIPSEPAGKPDSVGKAKVELEPNVPRVADSGPTSKPEPEMKSKAAPEAQAKLPAKLETVGGPKPETEVNPTSAGEPAAQTKAHTKPETKVDPAVAPSVGAAAEPEVKPGSISSNTETASGPVAKAGNTAKTAGPASEAKPETNASSKPDIDITAKPAAGASAANVES